MGSMACRLRRDRTAFWFCHVQIVTVSKARLALGHCIPVLDHIDTAVTVSRDIQRDIVSHTCSMVDGADTIDRKVLWKLIQNIIVARHGLAGTF